MTTPPRRPSAARAARRSNRPVRKASFLERNRNRLLLAGGAAVFALLAGMAFLNASQPAYACSTLFDPTPAPSWAAPTAAPVASGATPAPTSTPPPPGYVQQDMGKAHVPPGTRVRYTSCPPASGRHYNGAGIGPIAPKVYGAAEQVIPQGWLHNLEHAGIVLLYNCGPNGDAAACTTDGQAALAALYAKWPLSPICNSAPGTNDTPVIARFDDMAQPYAAVVWDVVLPLQTLDESAIFDFYARQGERNAPERPCAPPTPTPAPATPSPVPTATTAPTAAPTAAPTSTAPASTGSAAPTPAGS